MRKFIVAAALVASLTGVAAAAVASETAAPAAEVGDKAKKDKKEDPNRMVCTREHVLGSNRPEKVCMTVAERERRRDLARERLRSGNTGSSDNMSGTPSGM